MSSAFYEDTLLRGQYKLVAALQKDVEFSKYATIFYEDRILDNKKPVGEMPTGSRYPEIYFVEFKMPVYISAGQLRRDWTGSVKIQLSEEVLTNREADNPPDVQFNCSFSPFNNHVKDNWICAGNAWSVAKDNGLWHFIVSLGALINQDSYVTSDKREHLNSSAFDYWVQRGRKPVTDIKWPIDLLTREEKKIEFTEKEKKSDTTIKIVPKVNPSTTNQNVIKIVPKETSKTPEIKFTLKNK